MSEIVHPDLEEGDPRRTFPVHVTFAETSPETGNIIRRTEEVHGLSVLSVRSNLSGASGTPGLGHDRLRK